ncbi:SET and MYND domain-containing protein DDB_G0284059 [Eumeta japonica]|uniref:SET and MYND domain-containing protein DDB_G0284059 n=1 Tax=Eumeta variegata TaxID=151549 RepID=A0A4C2A7F3_EUMVA|nr:SET and MYND domain-containing protein DDB_G0284059 [Eumeta japonica]
MSIGDGLWLLIKGLLSLFDVLHDCMSHEEVSNAIDEVLSRVVALSRGKDARDSHERRLAASRALSAGDLAKALSLASQAVLKAPMLEENDAIDNGVSLALGLWLRSEILLKMEKYALALEDLKLALKERLPVKMRAIYYWRMGNCYKGIGETTRAKVSYELAHRLLKDENARNILDADITSLNNLSSAPQSENLEKEEVTLAAGAKTNLPSLSNLVKIIEEENKGRFAAANCDIKTGDVLLIESPYVACLLPDCYGTHCLHCFERLEAPVWCPKCSAVAFCTISCRDEALRTYHKYECQFIDMFIVVEVLVDDKPGTTLRGVFTFPVVGEVARLKVCRSVYGFCTKLPYAGATLRSGMSILSHVALRMITQAGLETSLSIHSKYISNEVKTVDSLIVNDIEGLSKKSKVKSRKERLNRNKKTSKGDKADKVDNDSKLEDEISFKEKLELMSAQIYSLCTHSDQRRVEDYLKRVLMAMFLNECLKKAGFFSGDVEGNIVKSN